MEQTVMKTDMNKEEDEIKTTIDESVVKVYFNKEGEETVKDNHILTTVHTPCNVCRKIFTNANYLKKHI